MLTAGILRSASSQSRSAIRAQFLARRPGSWSAGELRLTCCSLLIAYPEHLGPVHGLSRPAQHSAALRLSHSSVALAFL